MPKLVPCIGFRNYRYLPEELHTLELKQVQRLLKSLGLDSPNHGDPEVIRQGGYDKGLIDATLDYIRKMLERAHDADFLSGTMEDYLATSLANGWFHAWEPYRAVHEMNLQLVHDHYQGRPLPDVSGR